MDGHMTNDQDQRDDRGQSRYAECQTPLSPSQARFCSRRCAAAAARAQSPWR